MYIERSEPPRCWTAEIQGAKVNKNKNRHQMPQEQETGKENDFFLGQQAERHKVGCELYRVTPQFEGV